MVPRGWRIKNIFEICSGAMDNNTDVSLIREEVKER